MEHRGIDFRTSHDIEDIIYVLDNRTSIVEEINADDPQIKAFIKKALNKISQKGILQEVLISQIHPLMVEQRMPIAKEKISQTLNN